VSEQDDDLRDAFSALREAHDGASPDAPATRRRLLLAATNKRRRQITTLRIVVPLAAVLAASTAWAAATGRLPNLLSTAASLVGLHPAAPPTLSEAPMAPTAPAAPITPAPPNPEPNTDTIETRAVEDLPRALPSAPASAPPTKLPPPATARDAEDALYQQAHRAHFVDKDPQKALEAWDAYLEANPNGRFAPEARYNRALSLVRLGRRDDAKEALRPFADGAFGGYRQRDAKKLLDAL
jgi:tetratricopeptide (TPR) repeat protein